MSAVCLRALALLALLSSAAACSKVVQSSVTNVTALLGTASLWPMRLYMANEPAEARIYSCYTMDSNYTIKFTDSKGNGSYTLTPTSKAASSPTYVLKYKATKKYMLGASADGAEVEMQVQALYTDFVMWEGCENRNTRNYLFMKNGVKKENLDYRCMKTALSYTYSISTVPKGICS